MPTGFLNSNYTADASVFLIRVAAEGSHDSTRFSQPGEEAAEWEEVESRVGGSDQEKTLHGVKTPFLLCAALTFNRVAMH